MADIEIHPLTQRLIDLEAHLLDMDERLGAHQLVLSWLLAQHPDALRFLSAQANEMDKPGAREKFLAAIDLLDELREGVAQWPADPSLPDTSPR